jgi:hypothetical protein
MKQILFALVAVLVCGCEKMVIDNDVYSKGDNGGNVTLHITQTEGATRSSVLSDVCGRLNVAIFDAGGQKVKAIAQTIADAGFGSVSLSLAAGNYTVVAIGHNCTGSATITSADKVTFPNNKVTDTFSYFGRLTVTGDRQDVDIMMKRAVAMIRLHLTDEMAAMNDVAQFKFYYLGGSSTFSPSAGYGCVNSKQTEYRAYSDDGVYCLYTLPHSANDVLTKMTVTALDASDNALGEFIIEDVPVTVNKITDCTGNVRGGSGSVTATITVDTDWAGVNNYTY